MRDASAQSVASIYRGRERGFTLVELSIAIVIALFLIGGILTIELETKRTYTGQTALTQLQDNQRVAMALMTDVIQSAGYFPDPTTSTPMSAFPTLSGTFATAGQVLYGTHSSSAPGDAIYVRYATATGSSVILCDGSTNTSGAGHVYVNEFSVDGSGQLVCTLGTDAIGATAVALVSGVTNLQVLYGVTSSGSAADYNVDTYLTASQMSTSNWSSVTAVKVTLTFSNPLYGTQPGQPQTIDFTRVIDVMNRASVRT